MIEQLGFRFKWGIWATTVYIVMLGALLFYFNSRDSIIPKHYVKKNEHRVQITLAASILEPSVKKEIKPLVKPKVVKKNKVKKVPSTKPIVKKLIKEKVLKKVVKKQKTKDLFSQVKTRKREKEKKKKDKPVMKSSTPKVKTASERLAKTLKQQKQKEKGIKNAYFAKLEEKLRGWPAQSDYAGESATVLVQIKPSGNFTFKVLSASGNIAFNEGLMLYLKQLQRFGLGRHNGGKTYRVSVEFMAIQ